MDEDIFEILKKQDEPDEMAQAFPDFPCAMCARRNKCEGIARGCRIWEKWFGNEWKLIRKKFGK